MSRHEVKSRERYLARTKAQKLAYAYGIPHHYWSDDDSRPAFMPLECGSNGIVGTKQQQEWAQNLFLETTWQRPYLVVIGSDPTDDAAMTWAMQLARKMIDRSVNLVVQNMGAVTPVEADDDTSVYFGHNAMAEMSTTRAQSVRDWAQAHVGSLRILVVAGNPAVATFERLRLDPDAIFLLDDTKRKRTSLI